MKQLDSVTLYCPETSESGKSLWRRYLLRGVTLERTDSYKGRSAVMYVFPNKVRTFSGGSVCKMPKISAGCVVSPDVDVTDSEALVGSIADCGCLVVRSVKEYHRSGMCHVKAVLG